MSRLDSYLPQYPDSEVLGGSILAVSAALGEKAVPYFEKGGLADVQPDEWYSFPRYLNILYDIVAHEDDLMSNLVSIGMKVVETAPLPPQIDTAEKALMSMQAAWEMNSRHAHEINWEVEKVGDHKYICTNYSPFPKDIEYGVVYGFARRFAHGRHFTVAYQNLEDRDDDEKLAVTFVVEFSN